MDVGMSTINTINTLTLILSPRKNAAIKQIALCTIANGKANTL
jgi:hypothetical protein